jgi:2-dehydro-3-deoxyphosphogluconate aldolase/(4S)-4-hydroxy-2-oxoglutarate aldolase
VTGVSQSAADEIVRARLVPVLRSPSPAAAIETGRALADGGLNVVELTFSTPDVGTAIAALARSPSIVVGAGTVLAPSQAELAVEAGARFLVSPINPPWLVPLAHELGVLAVPGAATPSEAWAAHTSGAPIVKLFPIARLGGAPYVRDLRAVMPQVRVMVTGGVTVQSARELLDAGCAAVGLGSIHADESLGADPAQRARAAVALVGRGEPRTGEATRELEAAGPRPIHDELAADSLRAP